MILLLTNKWDLSIDFIVEECRKQSQNFFRLNVEDLPSGTLGSNYPGSSLVVELYGQSIDLYKDVHAVLNRGPGKPLEFSQILDPENTRFVQKQWASVVQALTANQNVFWMNHPFSDFRLQSKIVQLKEAERLGLNVPKTCITNSLSELELFFASCNEKVVAKSLASSLIEFEEQAYFVFTNRLDSVDDVAEDELALAPVIFQECFESKLDLRVTVIGTEVYPVAIRSKSQDGVVPLDWRTAHDGLIFDPIELPKTLVDSCLKFLADNQLQFGAIDFLLVDDKYYFLEVNTAGEWAWLERNANLPLSHSIVQNLSRNI